MESKLLRHIASSSIIVSILTYLISNQDECPNKLCDHLNNNLIINTLWALVLIAMIFWSWSLIKKLLIYWSGLEITIATYRPLTAKDARWRYNPTDVKLYRKDINDNDTKRSAESGETEQKELRKENGVNVADKINELLSEWRRNIRIANNTLGDPYVGYVKAIWFHFYVGDSIINIENPLRENYSINFSRIIFRSIIKNVTRIWLTPAYKISPIIKNTLGETLSLEYNSNSSSWKIKETT